MFKNIIRIIAAICMISMTACAGMTHKNKAPVVTGKIPVAERVAFDRNQYVEEPESKAGIWNETTSTSFLEDLRAHRVGDLVIVNIVETSAASKSASTQTGRQSSIDAGVDNLLGWEGRMKNLTSFGKSDVRGAYDNASMLKGSLTGNFTGSGSTSRDDSMTASITVRVVEVKPNGNLVIRGTREVRVNQETQVIILSGLIRPYDISSDNTILSSYIADARIEYIGTGAISDKQRPGWLTRAVDAVWPF